MVKAIVELSLAEILALDKLGEMREQIGWLEDFGVVTSKDVDNLQRLLDTLRKLVKIEERASGELAEESQEG